MLIATFIVVLLQALVGHRKGGRKECAASLARWAAGTAAQRLWFSRLCVAILGLGHWPTADEAVELGRRPRVGVGIAGRRSQSTPAPVRAARRKRAVGVRGDAEARVVSAGTPGASHPGTRHGRSR
jgi:hypothetical protein